MSYNVLINSVNIAYKQEEDQLLLLVEIADNPKLPDIKVLGAVMDRRLVGYLITELLRVLQVPTLNHAHNVPAILELNEQQWTLKNFINEDITYNTETITNYILDAAYEDTSAGEITTSK